jgi:predicted small lipoprotein YifL
VNRATPSRLACALLLLGALSTSACSRLGPLSVSPADTSVTSGDTGDTGDANGRDSTAGREAGLDARAPDQSGHDAHAADSASDLPAVDLLSPDLLAPDLKPSPDSKPDQLTADFGALPAVSWNPADKQKNIMLSQDQLTASVPVSTGSLNDSVRATLGHTSGKWYWEVVITARSQSFFNSVGLGTTTASLEDSPSLFKGGCDYDESGRIACHGSPSVSGSGYKAGDIVGVALDLDGRRVYFSLNGVWQLGPPAAVSGGLTLDAAKARRVFPMVTISKGDAMTAHFAGVGGKKLHASPPVGYTAGWRP